MMEMQQQPLQSSLIVSMIQNVAPCKPQNSQVLEIFDILFIGLRLLNCPFIFDLDPVFDENRMQHDQLNTVIQSLIQQADELKRYIALSKKKRGKNQRTNFLSEHQAFLDDITQKLRNLNLSKKSLSTTSTLACLPQSSTPYRTNGDRKPFTFSVGSQIANSSQFC